MTTLLLNMIIGVPLAIALALILAGKRAARVAGWLAGAAAVTSLLCTFALIPQLQSKGVFTPRLAWIPSVGIELRMHLDWLSLPFLITEAATTLLAIIYAWGYHHTDERDAYFYALLLIFAVGMAGTTLADDMALFYTFWELMLVASALLILVWGEEQAEGPQRTTVVFKYVIFTHLGSLLVLIGLLSLYDVTGTDSFSALRAGVTLAPALVRTLIPLFLIGFSVKMAIFPLHLWLPDAHTVAPMPVTIMLAAAMLAMGTYGILRFPFSLFTLEVLAPYAVPMMVAGIVSAIYGALMALAERDVKRIVAYSSVSQMGYILFGLGTLTSQGIIGATLHVIYHATVKALLFMAMGIVIAATGKRHIEKLSGLWRALPLTAISATIGALAIAGMPPLCIFDSEWMIFAGGFATPHFALAALALFGSLLTVAYALWLVGSIFLGTTTTALTTTASSRREGADARPVADPIPLAMLAPTVLLALLAIIEGLFPAPLFNWVTRELPFLFGGAG